ncbi:MAG: exodeoxyribonuclease III [Clostridia bacterium]|nr:exodeoxyribonuclease III [Clostridia bacterium]
MKLISWNVNGLRACAAKGFFESAAALDADMIALQETKMQEGQFDGKLEGYHAYFNYAEKKGYSGTALFSRVEPLNVSFGMGIEEHDREGRVITAEYEDFTLVVCYTPNSQRELARLDYRMRWEADFRQWLMALDEKKPVILCGDLNVAHQEIDLKNPASNHMNAGFTDQERAAFTELLSGGFIDSFRCLHPDETGAYSWWSYIGHARDRNTGWRIDYFVVSEKLRDRIAGAVIHNEIFGSDHCPVELTLA